MDNRDIVERELLMIRKNTIHLIRKVDEMDDEEVVDTMKVCQIINALLLLQSLAVGTDGDPELIQDTAKQVMTICNKDMNQMISRYAEGFGLGVPVPVPVAYMM